VSNSRHFGKQLVRELVTPLIKRRLATQWIQRAVRTKAECYLNIRGTVEEEEAADGQAADGEELIAANQEAVAQEPFQPAKRTRRCCVCVAAASDRR
jgi:hypothetical protein